MRAQAHPHVLGGGFVLALRQPSEEGQRILALRRDVFDDVDLGDEKVREALCAYVGTHIRLHPDDLDQLAEAGLAMHNGRVVTIDEARDREAVEAASIATVAAGEARRRARRFGVVEVPGNGTPLATRADVEVLADHLAAAAAPAPAGFDATEPDGSDEGTEPNAPTGKKPRKPRKPTR